MAIAVGFEGNAVGFWADPGLGWLGATWGESAFAEVIRGQPELPNRNRNDFEPQ